MQLVRKNIVQPGLANVIPIKSRIPILRLLRGKHEQGVPLEKQPDTVKPTQKRYSTRTYAIAAVINYNSAVAAAVLSGAVLQERVSGFSRISAIPIIIAAYVLEAVSRDNLIKISGEIETYQKKTWTSILRALGVMGAFAATFKICSNEIFEKVNLIRNYNFTNIIDGITSHKTITGMVFTTVMGIILVLAHSIYQTIKREKEETK